MSTKYINRATRGEANTDLSRISRAYYSEECTARGLTLDVDSLDMQGGRVLSLARAVTDVTMVGRVITLDVAGVGTRFLLEVPGAGEEIPDDPALVEESALSAAVQAALENWRNPNEPPSNPGGQGGGGTLRA